MPDFWVNTSTFQFWNVSRSLEAIKLLNNFFISNRLSSEQLADDSSEFLVDLVPANLFGVELLYLAEDLRRGSTLLLRLEEAVYDLASGYRLITG